MKKYKFTLLILSILISAIFLSCDDSGVIHHLGIKGTFRLQTFNLKHINETVDGYYELWIMQDSSGIGKYYSCGKFNIGFDGSVTDTAGGQMTFKFTGDTSRLDNVTVALISIEPYGTCNRTPASTRFLSCGLSTDPYKDSIYGTLTVSGAEGMGASGDKITKSSNGQFTVMTPTGWGSTCLRGLWFCYPYGGSSLSPNLTLPNNSPWIYEGWLVDTTNPANPIYYSMGRFYDPYHADLDSAGPCRGPNQAFDKPGQDWVKDSCLPGKPGITNLCTGRYQVMITLEPANEQPGTIAYESPFPLRAFWGPYMPSSCNSVQTLYSMWYYWPPRARLKIIN